jgi:hypothetical protein
MSSYRYTLGNLFGAVVSMSFILQDYRIAFMILAVLVNGVWSAFGDAMPSGMRRTTSILGQGAAVVILVIIQIGLFLKLIAITDVTYIIGNVAFTFSNMATSCMTNTIVFCCRNVVTAILNPRSLTVIKSAVQNVKISKIEARVLYAAFHLKEAARYLKEEENINEERV